MTETSVLPEYTDENLRALLADASKDPGVHERAEMLLRVPAYQRQAVEAEVSCRRPGLKSHSVVNQMRAEIDPNSRRMADGETIDETRAQVVTEFLLRALRIKV